MLTRTKLYHASPFMLNDWKERMSRETNYSICDICHFFTLDYANSQFTGRTALTDRMVFPTQRIRVDKRLWLHVTNDVQNYRTVSRRKIMSDRE
jgi:hypothetical protein